MVRGGRGAAPLAQQCVLVCAARSVPWMSLLLPWLQQCALAMLVWLECAWRGLLRGAWLAGRLCCSSIAAAWLEQGLCTGVPGQQPAA